MSNIKILFTENFGQIIGEVSDNLDNTYTIKNPCVIQISNQQLGFLPLLATTVEKEMILNKNKVIGNMLYTPENDLYSHFSSQFGSGIQLTTDPKIR